MKTISRAAFWLNSLLAAVFRSDYYRVKNSFPRSGDSKYIATVHFILPFALFYAVNANSPLSRPIIAIYIVVLGAMTIAGKGFLGKLPVNETLKVTGVIVVVVAVLLWLMHSPKMRIYYALLWGQEIPIELEERREKLTTTDWLGPRGKAVLSSILENLETVVLLGFIAAVILAFAGF
jgi:hypothetical protein